MSSRLLHVKGPLYEYLLTRGVREHPVLADLRRTTSALPAAGMQISPEQGAFMTLLVAALGVRRALEVGVFTGYSSLCVALSLPADGKLVACDVSKEWTDIARQHWLAAGVADRIELLLQPATLTLDELLASGQAGSFDFAFIDADKSNYDSYYEKALRLLRVNGVIAIDNVLWSGAVVDDARQDADTIAIRALNEKLRGDERVELSMLPIGDGLTLLRKR